MSCKISYDALEKTLLSAYKSNFEKYKNLDAIVSDVLNLSVPEEVRIHAVWYYAGYVNQLANNIPQLQTSAWSQGKYKSLHEYLTPSLTGEVPFNYGDILTEINTYFAEPLDIDKTESLEDRLIQMISDLKSLSDVSLGESLDEIVNAVVSNIRNLDPVILDPNNTNAVNILRLALDELKARPDNPSKITSINRLSNIISNIISNNNVSIDYISMRDAEGIGRYNNSPIYELRKKNGDLLEVYFDSADNRYHYYQPGTENHERVVDFEPTDQVTSIYGKTNDRVVNPDTMQLRMHTDEILTGLIIGESTAKNDRSKTVQQQIAEEAQKGAVFYSSVKITASTKRQAFNAQRQARIDTNFPILGRTVETEERPNQDSALKSGSSGVILTLYKPTTGFTVTVSNHTGNLSFDLESFTNLAFVYSDNTVQPVDFNNPEHIALMKSMVEVDSPEFRANRYEAITDEQIENLKQGVERYKDFEEEVNQLLTDGSPTDIKEIFFKYYDLVNATNRIVYNKEAKVGPKLSQHIDASNGRLNVKVQNYDKDGNAVGGPTDAKIALIMRKARGIWVVEDTLDEGQKLVGEDGKEYSSVQAYIEKEAIEKDFEDTELDIKAWADKVAPTANSIYVSLKAVGNKLKPIAVPLVYQKQVKSPTDLLNAMGALTHTFENAAFEEGNKAVLQLKEEGWGFDTVKTKEDSKTRIAPEIVLLKEVGGVKTFGIRFSMLSPNEEQNKVFDDFAQKHMQITFNSGVIDKIMSLSKQALAEAGIKMPASPTLETVMLSYEKAARKLGSSHPLIDEMKKAYMDFSNDIKGKFQSVLNKHDILLGQGQISVPMFDNTFRQYGLFDNTTLKLYRRGNRKSNILDSYSTMDHPMENSLSLTYRNPLKKIVLPKILTKTSVASIDVSEVDSPVVILDSEPAIDPAGVVETATQEVVDLNQVTETESNNDPFMLANAIEAFLTLSEEDFAKEVNAMKALLPDRFQFTYEGFANLDVDGHALGYVQGLMIHLNDTLKAKGVAFHEGFHAVFRNLLNEKQQKYYLKKAGEVLGNYKTDEKGKYLTVNGKKVYANEFRQERRYLHLNDEQIKNLIYEEYLADGFASYMEKGVVPKTWMQKLFAWLKKLLNVFKKGGRIDNLYYDISVGKFKNKTITETKANTENLYSLYKGLPASVIVEGGTIKPSNQQIQSSLIAEVSTKLIAEMAGLKATYPSVKAEDLYDFAVANVLNDYNIEDLTSQVTDPTIQKSIINDYDNHYSNARWLLGQYHNSNEPFKYVNLTNNPGYSDVIVDRTTPQGANQLAISKKAAGDFKEDVIEEFKSLDVITDFDDTADLISLSNKEDEESELSESFDDRGAIGLPPNEGTAAFRKMFKYIQYDYVDPRYGIKRKRSVDSGLIFSTIRKVTCNVQKEHVVYKLKEEIDRLTNEVNYFNVNIKNKIGGAFDLPADIAKQLDLRDSLQAVFNTLHKFTKLEDVTDENGKIVEIQPKKNQHIYIQFANVFNTIDINLALVSLETKKEWVQENKKTEIAKQIYRINDIVIGKDVNTIRTELLDKIIMANISDEQFNSAKKELGEVEKMFSNTNILKDELFFTETGLLNDAEFRKIVDKTYVALSKLNVGIPYSVVQLGLAFNLFKINDYKTNIFTENSDVRILLRNNKVYWKNLQDLDFRFFTQMVPNAVGESLNTNVDDKLGRRSQTLQKALSRVGTAYLNSFGEFVLKYDPTLAGSVTRNAAGDMISKYCKPTPAFVTILKLQQGDNIEEGLENLIGSFFSGFESYFEDNPLLNTESDLIKAFLSDFKVSAFAGFEHKVQEFGTSKQGDPVTFKDIDDKSYALAMMGLFANQTEKTVGKSKLRTFKKILTIYEATSTSIVVDGIYKKYADGNGSFLKQQGFSLLTHDLFKVVKQEYNLIKKNFEEHREKNAPKKFLGYNINPEKDRGFTFNILSDFFQVNVEDESKKNTARAMLRDEFLIAAAKDGDLFETMVSANPELVQQLMTELEAYANEQYDVFKGKLVDLGITTADLPLATEVFLTDKQLQGLSLEERDTAKKEHQISRRNQANTFLKEMFANNWINGIFVNQLFDGPIAVTTKSFADFFKRQKTGAAAGENIYNPLTKQTHYKASIIPRVDAYIDNADLTKPVQFTPHLDENGDELESNVKVKLFDGQSLNHLNRRIKIAEAEGKLDPESAKILRSMRWNTRSSAEYSKGILQLREAGIVFNSLKTVSASGLYYLKQSEHTLLRKDVSMLKAEYRSKDMREQAEKELSNLYELADTYAGKVESGISYINPLTNEPYDYDQLYNRTIAEIHSYFEPIKGREILHNLLNSMEVHDVDQLMDTEASKRATVEPTMTNYTQASAEDYYFGLSDSSFYVPNELTYIQVETGKIATSVTQAIQQKLLLIAQLDPNSEDYKAIKKDIEGYQKGLADAVSAQTKKMMRLLNVSDKEIVGKLYTNIANGLREQGAPAVMLQYFELNPDGTPVHDPNLPVLGETLVYYFTSMFNKNIFDKKTAGRKYFHVSSFGYNVIEQDGKVITQDEYKRNPGKYKNAIVRQPSVIKQEDGTYVVEVIIPKELRNVDQKFLEEYLSEFFATRIPTEDKRSMMVAKVVDYIDEAYGANIIVPFQVHMLSGSDFDIDALYAHVKSSYRTADGEKIPFGEYKHYMKTYQMTLKEAKFMEYLHYMSKDDSIKELIDLEVDKIKNQTGYKKEQAIRFGEIFGGNIKKYFEDNAGLAENKDEDKRDLADDFKKVIATFNVLQTLKESELPVTPNELQNYTDTTGATPVVDVIMNNTLQHKINILSNAKVFENFLANPNNRADAATAPYERLVEKRGMSEKDLYNRQNLYSPAALMTARALNSESKDSLGIAASFNKGISMLTTIKAQLKTPVGKLYTKDGVIETDRIVDNAVQLVGGSIGLFADAPKNPFPGPLHLNTVTTPVMNTMFALGFPQDAAIMFQSLPIIVQMVSKYNQNYGSAYKANNTKKMSFKTFLNAELGAKIKELLPELVESNLVTINENGTPVFNLNAAKLVWSGEVSPGNDITNFGYDVTHEDGTTLSEGVKSLILMAEFRNYTSIADSISFDITSLTDTLKAVKPDMERFDRLLNTYGKAYTESSKLPFTDETMKNLFEQYPVLQESLKAITYMDKLSRSIFLERTGFMKGLTGLLTSGLYGYDSSDLKKDLKAFLALQLQKSAMESNPAGYFPQLYLNLLKPENFLSADILADYEYIKKEYPNNAFIKQLQIVNVGDSSQGIRALKMVSSKLNKNQKDAVYSDFTALVRDSIGIKERAWRLAYYGMIKSGAKKARGGFFELLPAVISKNMSNAMSDLRKDLVELDELALKLKLSDGSRAEYNEKLNQIVNKNFNGTSLEGIITEAISKIVSIHLMNTPDSDYKRVISLSKVNENIEDVATKEDLIDFVKLATGEYADNIINDKGELPSVGLSIEPTYRLKQGEIELFVPTGTTLKITLNSDMNEKQKAFLVQSKIRTLGDKFIFPIYKKNIYGQMLVLKKIDDRSIGDAFMNSLFETTSSDSSAINITGLSAEYEVVPQQGTAEISPLAFGMNEGATIKNMTSQKVMQLSSVRADRLPASMRIVSAENRMYQILKANYPVPNHLNKTYVRDDNSKVTVANKFTGISYFNGRVLLHPMNQGNGATYNELDLLAQKLGRNNWQVLKEDPEFEDFFAGKSRIHLYQLVNNDNLSTNARNQAESGNITDKDIDDTLEDNTCNGG